MNAPGHRKHSLTSLSEPYKNESLGNRQARNVAKAAVAEGGRCREVIRALGPWVDLRKAARAWQRVEAGGRFLTA